MGKVKELSEHTKEVLRRSIRDAAPKRHIITRPEFFTAGNAYFTVSNGRGKRYTFRIRKPDESTPFFVSMMFGPDNSNDYVYIGLYIPQDHSLRLTAKSRIKEDSTPAKVFQWAVRMVAAGKELPEGYAIQHEGRCGRCGRRLTVPESIESGIGPECAKFFGVGV